MIIKKGNNSQLYFTKSKKKLILSNKTLGGEIEMKRRLESFSMLSEPEVGKETMREDTARLATTSFGFGDGLVQNDPKHLAWKPTRDT